VPKISGKWLLPMLAVPMALAVGAANANPWLERSETAAQSWDDIPFLGPPQRRTQKPPRSPESARALETKRELERELHRMPEANRAVNPTASANVFPTPRVPSQTQTAAVRARDTVTVRVRDAEQELQRELQRTQPASVVPPVTEPLACAERLAKIARYEPLPSRTGPNGCGASDLVRLDSIKMPDRTNVALNPAPQIRCSMAEQVAEWIREDVGPAAVELGAPLLSISDNDAYDCRSRNNIKGAQLSEHGRGNALDITAIRLRNGGVFNLTDQMVTKPFRDRIRAAACGRFMTVLGPGSDAYHASHVHLDMAERARKTRVCQWNVREEAVAARTEPQPPQPAVVASAPPVRTAPPVIAPPPAALAPSVRSEPEPPAVAPPAVASAPPEQIEPVPPADAPSVVASAPPVRSEPERSAAAPPATASAPPEQPEPARPAEAPPAVASAPPVQSEPEPPAAAPPAVASAPPEQSEPEPPAEAPSVVASAPPVRSEPEPPADAPPAASAPPVQTAAAPPKPAGEPASVSDVSPPLPLRKPEALVVEPLAQVAVAPPEPAATSAAPVAERPSEAEASPPPLPRRKPEALLTLAQAQQFETQNRMGREWRTGRPRYDSRRHFEREMRRFMRNFF
jgi:hypothetical protein